jgi:hypothetical protein
MVVRAGFQRPVIARLNTPCRSQPAGGDTCHLAMISSMRFAAVSHNPAQECGRPSKQPEEKRHPKDQFGGCGHPGQRWSAGTRAAGAQGFSCPAYWVKCAKSPRATSGCGSVRHRERRACFCGKARGGTDEDLGWLNSKWTTPKDAAQLSINVDRVLTF